MTNLLTKHSTITHSSATDVTSLVPFTNLLIRGVSVLFLISETSYLSLLSLETCPPVSIKQAKSVLSKLTFWRNPLDFLGKKVVLDEIRHQDLENILMFFIRKVVVAASPHQHLRNNLGQSHPEKHLTSNVGASATLVSQQED